MRSSGVDAASAANPSGVMMPVPIPTATAAARIPISPGIMASANPAAVTTNPHAMPRSTVIFSASSARPARGCANAAHNASIDTAAPVAIGPRPALTPATGRNPTPTDNAAVDAARATVGPRNWRSLRRRTRSMTVCLARGSGGSAGTETVAQTATTSARTAMTANRRVRPPTHTITPPSNGPRV